MSYGPQENEGARLAPASFPGPTHGTAPEEGDGADVKKADVLVLPKVSYNVKTGETIIVPQAVQQRVDGFVAPLGYKRTGSRDVSYIYSWGVNLEPDGSDSSSKKTKKWICLANDTCLQKGVYISTKDATSGVNKHLKTRHNVVGSISAQRQNTVDTMTSSAAVGPIGESSKTHGVGRQSKWCVKLQYARVVIKNLLPLKFGEDEEVRILFSTLAKDAPRMPVERTRHIIAEMYVATQAKMLKGLAEAIAEAPLPIVHFNVDLWTCNVSGKKYIGIHIFWVNAEGVFKHALVAVVPYCPDPATLGTQRAAAMLWRIFTTIMKDAGVGPFDLASCTTDSGSDFESMCVNHASEYGILWDWCTSDMISNVFEHAFGTSAGPSKPKNPAARDLIKVVIKVIERLNRSPKWRAKFDDIHVEDLGLCLKKVKHAPKRWLSLSKALERVICLWHPLKTVFLNDGQTFPLEAGNKKNGVLELYSLMAPLTGIMHDGQHYSLPMNGEIHMTLSLLNVTLLSETEQLKVFQIPSAGTKAKTSAGLPFSMKNDSNLSDVARATRRELRAAFACRFTARVWDSSTVNPSFYRDAAVILVPTFSSAKHLDMLKLKDGDDAGLPAAKKALIPTTSDEVKFLRDQVWDEIRERAVKATLVEGARNEDMVQVREKKRVKLSATSGASSTGNSAWAMFEERENTDQDNGSPQAQEARRVADAGKAVDEEVQRFKDLNLPPGSMSPRNALVFWSGSARTQFPKLWRVAQQVYGNQASVTQIEREFGGAGQLLSSRRSHVDSMYIEMMLFLHLNFKQIPQQVPGIKNKTLDTVLPKRFTGSNEEFEKAMQYVNSDMPGVVDTYMKEENH